MQVRCTERSVSATPSDPLCRPESQDCHSISIPGRRRGHSEPGPSSPLRPLQPPTAAASPYEGQGGFSSFFVLFCFFQFYHFSETIFLEQF